MIQMTILDVREATVAEIAQMTQISVALAAADDHLNIQIKHQLIVAQLHNEIRVHLDIGTSIQSH